LLAAVMAVAADAPKDDATKKDFQRLQGAWQLQHSKADGRVADGPVWWVVVSRNRLTLVLGHMGEVSGPLKLDATKQPPTMDVDFQQDEVSLRGIYEVKGDTLRICLSLGKAKEQPKGRPKEFDAKKGSPYAVWVLKRVKK
jgi:uncharacterized protein (TIGR03067 family)